ncbi:hypothetical protein HI914_03963 [Erysiphe necator]|nr:hypothetical protein HI914_03963 [Erysiphe necator]
MKRVKRELNYRGHEVSQFAWSTENLRKKASLLKIQLTVISQIIDVKDEEFLLISNWLWLDDKRRTADMSENTREIYDRSEFKK